MEQILSSAFKTNGTKILTALALAAALVCPHRALAAGPAAIDLGSCAHFTILATSTTTTTGGGIINGDVGLSPAGSQGIPPAQINGTIYNGDLIAAEAQTNLTTAFNAASPGNLPGGIDVGAELGGLTLVPGVYTSSSGSYTITSKDLTLNGGPNDVWIFQMSTTLIVDVGRSVILTGGALARNIFWQVGTSATLNTSAVFEGTIMAYDSITMNASSTLDGRALAEIGAVVYDGSNGTLPAPAAPVFTSISKTPTNTVTVLSTSPYFLLTLQTTTNLLSAWTTIATSTPVTSLWAFTNALVTPATNRFYQAFITPYP